MISATQGRASLVQLTSSRTLVRAQFASSKAMRAKRAASSVVCSSRKDEEQPSLAQRFALPAAAVLGAALLFAATPDEALAARSGVRVGGSGFSRRR